MRKKKFPKWKQGQFHPQNKEKYSGQTKIFYRSDWERRCMVWLDQHPKCVKWGSESKVVYYQCPLSGNRRRYFLDFHATFETKEGLQTFIIEVKPSRECAPPKRGKMKEKNYLRAVATYKTNQAKWEAAKDFAKRKGYKFIVLTEKELFKK